jgi:tetrahydromethanopterin S-methyltransferase subunit A
LEHYTNAGVLDCVINGMSGSALYTEAIRRHLLERLDHAGYLGRELARAERTLDTGEPYVQDKAPGQPSAESPPSTCECSGQCGLESELR